MYFHSIWISAKSEVVMIICYQETKRDRRCWDNDDNCMHDSYSYNICTCAKRTMYFNSRIYHSRQEGRTWLSVFTANRATIATHLRKTVIQLCRFLLKFHASSTELVRGGIRSSSQSDVQIVEYSLIVNYLNNAKIWLYFLFCQCQGGVLIHTRTEHQLFHARIHSFIRSWRDLLVWLTVTKSSSPILC